MQTVEKKQRRSLPHGRLLLLLLLAAGAIAAMLLTQRIGAQPDQVSVTPGTAQNLFAYAPDDVLSIAVTRSVEEGWAVTRGADGLFELTGEDGFTLSQSATDELADAACIIPCEAVLSDDPAEYEAHLADYGLADPLCTAVITYADGVTASLRIGSAAPHDPTWSYMLVDGDPRLFSFSKGMIETLFVSRASLRDVTQPLIHKARIDRITLRGTDGQITQEWQLRGGIDSTDAIDRWQLTVPFPYPADAEAMTSLLSNASNLRLGAYVGPATTDRLTECGFDAPRLTIEMHMAAGTIGSVNMDGEFITEDWPESTTTLVIGGERSDMVDYVLFDGHVYISSHFTMGVFMSIDHRSTMSRYPVLTALGNLKRLLIEKDGAATVYELIRTEQVAENNELVLDVEGNVIYDVRCTRDGADFDYAAFEAAYARLTLVTVSGLLPDDERLDAPPHTIYTFEDVDGTVHTVALSTFDVLHDAVSVNGQQAFYLIKGGFALGLD